MFTVAPSGRVKLEMRRDTPARFSTASMVTGRVEAEEAVEKAMSRAGEVAWKCFRGDNLNRRSRMGSVTKA